jgi:hypothetical protein
MPVRMLVKKSATSNPYHNKTNQIKRSGFGLGGKNARLQRKNKEFQAKRQKRRKESER